MTKYIALRHVAQRGKAGGTTVCHLQQEHWEH
ncbi:hypothetical protein L915_17785, partial [Phytophthora nicotianae]